MGRDPDPIAPDADGGYSVTMEEVGRIELHLDAAYGNMVVQGAADAGPGFRREYTMQLNVRMEPRSQCG